MPAPRRSTTAAKPAPRDDAWTILGPGGGGTMLSPTISPHDGNLVLEHCDMTGAYITTDGARSWRLFSLRSVVECFAFDPQDPEVIYAGNAALWRSEDRGKTWSMLLPHPTHNTVEHMSSDHADWFLTSDDPVYPPQARILAIAVDPGDARRIYTLWFGRRDHGLVLASEDRGQTWRRAGEVGPGLALSVAADGALYAVCDDGVHVLKDGRWEHRSGPVGGAVHYTACGQGGGPELTIYALVSNRGGWEPYCQSAHFSRDGGKTWTDLTASLVAALPAVTDGTKYEFRALDCQQGDAATAYVGFVRFGPGGKWRASGAGVTTSGIEHSGIAKTTDGGETWQIVFSEKSRSAENLAASWIEGRGIDHSIWLDAPVSLGVAPGDGRVCYATDLFRTYRTLDGGATWETVNSVRKGKDRWTTRGLDVTTCYGVHFDPFDINHMFITYTDIGMFQSQDGGKSWSGATEGIPSAWRNTTYWIAFDPEVKDLLWGVFAGNHDLPRPKMWARGGVGHYRGGVAVSRDGGLTWELSNEGMAPTAATDILLDPTSPAGRRTLYVCGFGTGVWKSTDNGQTWALKNQGLEKQEPFAWRLTRADDGTLYLIVARRSDDGSLGTEEDGALYRSTDGAETWAKTNLPEGCNGPNALTLDPTDNRLMYLSAWGRLSPPDDEGGGVYLSTDGGTTWQHIFARSQYVYDVTVDPRNPKVLYACGFDSAAYRSTDRGKTWSRIKGYNFKWGHRVIPDPVRPRKVYITTFGGSLWHGPAAGDPKAAEDIMTPLRSGTDDW